MRQRSVCAVEQAENVELDHPLPFRQRRVDNGAEQHDAGIVDQRVQAAKLSHAALYRACRLLLVGDIGLDHQRCPAGLANVCGQRFQPIGSPCCERDRGPVLGERPGCGRSDSA